MHHVKQTQVFVDKILHILEHFIIRSLEIKKKVYPIRIYLE